MNASSRRSVWGKHTRKETEQPKVPSTFCRFPHYEPLSSFDRRRWTGSRVHRGRQRRALGPEGTVESHSQLGTRQTDASFDARRHPRFQLEVDIRVYARDCLVVRGHSVDIPRIGDFGHAACGSSAGRSGSPGIHAVPGETWRFWRRCANETRFATASSWWTPYRQTTSLAPPRASSP